MSDFQIVNIDPNTGVATLGIPMPPQTIYGMDLLVQIVVLEYLRDNGRDVLYPIDGADLRSEIGQYNLSSDAPLGEFAALVVQRTQKIQDEIVRDQGSVGDPTERLKSLTILGVGLDSTGTDGAIRVQIVNEAGDVSDVII